MNTTGTNLAVNILLSGAHIENKGDELMLLAVRQRLLALDSTIRMVRDRFAGSYEERARRGFYHLLWNPGFSSLSGTVGYVIMKRYRQSFGIMTEDELDAVLDFSGFTYTDEWGPKNSEDAAKRFVRWKKGGKRIIMLPQAFGPFRDSRTVSAVRTMIDQCDLVYAREAQSLEMLVEAVGRRPYLKCAPDFTNLISGIVPDDFNVAHEYACIVPNHWMIRKVAADERQAYVRFLSAAIAEIDRRGIEPLMLFHAPFQDREFIEPIEAETGRALKVVSYTEPQHLKGVLGNARVVVSSRFHALVGSLSQAVPSIGLGWTHKFAQLFDEYQSPELLLRASAAPDAITAAVGQVLDDPARTSLIARLTAASERHSQATRAMWSDVERTLGYINGHAA